MELLKQDFPAIALIGSDPMRLGQLQTALGFLYRVATFEDGREAISRFYSTPPEVFVVDDGGETDAGLRIIQSVRAVHSFRGTPVVFCAKSKDTGLAHSAKMSGANALISWPIERQSFLSAIGKLRGKGVEANWQKLPPIQRTALERTVQSFRTIADCIERGGDVPILEIQESCGPLIDAVQSDAYSGILDGVKYHDDYTYAHSLRVATFLSLFGHRIGIRGDDLLTLASGGLLHDVGKMTIPPDVLHKPGKLSEQEWILMKGHVKEASSVLDRSPDISRGVRIITEQHHEKLDGSGYPKGLKGTELNELARMAAIADVFGALTDRRPYKEALPPERALTIMEEMKDGLDQVLLTKFRDFLDG
jgi:HD-GYP domain-containing protein (c-di-GMP phosphodiesterase class II)